MRRFFIEKSKISKDKVIITSEEAHHIKDVIRLKLGDEFIGLDGEGFQYICKINNITKDKIEALIESKEKSPVKIPNVTLGCAIPKMEKMDYVVRKAAELRVKTLIPMETDRTEVKLNAQKAEQKVERWQKIAKEASKQCARCEILKISQVEKFEDIIKNSNEYKIKLIPCLCDKPKPIKTVLSKSKAESIIVLIGPEGDFTAKETDAAIKAGFIPVSLGPTILRIDTAAIFAISAIMYEYF